MCRTCIHNVTIIQSDELVSGQTVVFENGKIRHIQKADETDCRQADRCLDGNGGYLVPGFIDLHIHGHLRWTVDNGTRHLDALCNSLPRFGVTGWLPTISPRPPGEDARYLKTLADVRSNGAEILAFHMEGPFLSRTGALPPEAIGVADIERVKSLIAAARPYNLIFSVAPDFEGVGELIPLMQQHGPVFMTHTAAGVADTQKAIEAGARHATHFYDVFPAPAETDPGVRPVGAVEAILADPRITVDFILDGVHVHPVAVKMAIKCKGRDNVCLITDGNVGAGLPPGRYTGIGDRPVEFECPGGPARIRDGSDMDGTLAGSGLTMDRAVRNAIDMLELELPQAVQMASTNPAQVLGIEDRKGRIKTGYDADCVLLNQEFKVCRTWVKGEQKFRQQE